MAWGAYSNERLRELPRGADKTKGKRERHTFDGPGVAHAWAHQSVSWGNRSDRRMFFDPDEGPRGRISTIYSYGRHFPIATLYERHKRRIVLFTTGSYSTSTSGHMGDVRASIPGTYPIHYVPDPRNPDEAREAFKRKIAEHVKNAAITSKKRRTLPYISEARQLVADANAFAKDMGYAWRFKAPGISAEMEEHAEELEAKHRVREANKEARQEVLRKARVERAALEIKAAIVAWRAATPSTMDRDRYAYSGADLYLKPKHWGYEHSPEWTEADQAELTRRAQWYDANKLSLWRARGGYGSGLQGTYLRIADGAYCEIRQPEGVLFTHDAPRFMPGELVGEIETSKSISFPLEHGVRALPLIRRACERKGWTPEASKDVLWQRNGHTIHLGHYAIDRIERRADGVHIIAGCHDVPLAEVEHVAKQLGL